jgi:acyl carrier protein
MLLGQFRAPMSKQACNAFETGHEKPTAANEDIATKLRNLIAEHLGLDVENVSDEPHFLKDLGADWLDRLELMIVIEDQFGVEFTDGVVDRIEAVGDLIRFIEAGPLH